MKEDKPTFRQLLHSSFKSEDTEEWLDVWFTRPIGLVFALFWNRLGVHPNAITILSIFLRSSRRMDVPLYRHHAQPARSGTAHVCQLLRQHRRTDGKAHRQENTNRQDARRVLGRRVVFLHLRSHSRQTDAPERLWHRHAVGHRHLDARCLCRISCLIRHRARWQTTTDRLICGY